MYLLMRLYEFERKKEITKLIEDNNLPLRWEDGVDGGIVIHRIKKWCNTHQRDATRCPHEGGIMLPCAVSGVIDCAEAGIEIWDEYYDFSAFDEMVLALDPEIPDAELVPVGGCTAWEIPLTGHYDINGMRRMLSDGQL